MFIDFSKTRITVKIRARYFTKHKEINKYELPVQLNTVKECLLIKMA